LICDLDRTWIELIGNSFCVSLIPKFASEGIASTCELRKLGHQVAQTNPISIRAAALLVALSFLAPTGARAANPNVLWEIVHNECVQGRTGTGDPSPCAVVDLRRGERRGFAVLKDTNGASQYLLIPTSHITGIEAPEILARRAENYFAAAWHWRSLFESLLHRRMPRDGISLAINSTAARSQNQLHIHIDCVRPDVRSTIGRNQEKISSSWAPFPQTLAGHHYMARRVLGTDLDVNPFKLLASRMPGAAAHMGTYSLVVVGATFPGNRNGFVILAGHQDPASGDAAAGEELQDHGCAIAKDQTP
jgi:CDP-diacylglycerol pyrophosphatase